MSVLHWNCLIFWNDGRPQFRLIMLWWIINSWSIFQICGADWRFQNIVIVAMFFETGTGPSRAASDIDVPPVELVWGVGWLLLFDLSLEKLDECTAGGKSLSGQGACRWDWSESHLSQYLGALLTHQNYSFFPSHVIIGMMDHHKLGKFAKNALWFWFSSYNSSSKSVLKKPPPTVGLLLSYWQVEQNFQYLQGWRYFFLFWGLQQQNYVYILMNICFGNVLECCVDYYYIHPSIFLNNKSSHPQQGVLQGIF